MGGKEKLANLWKDRMHGQKGSTDELGGSIKVQNDVAKLLQRCSQHG